MKSPRPQSPTYETCTEGGTGPQGGRRLTGKRRGECSKSLGHGGVRSVVVDTGSHHKVSSEEPLCSDSSDNVEPQCVMCNGIHASCTMSNLSVPFLGSADVSSLSGGQ